MMGETKAQKRKELKELALVIAEHQANLMRLAEAWGQRICDALDDADRKTIARLKTLLSEVMSNYKVNTAKSLSQLDYIRSKIEELRVRAYVKAEKSLREEANELIDNETKWAWRISSELTGMKAAAFAPLTDARAQKLLKNSIQINKTWAEWWTNTAAADVARVANVVNAGVVSGATIDQMTREIMGTKANNYTDGVMSTNRSHARNMARTICCGIANQAKDEFYRENSDIIKQVEWLSTLDGKTCPICGGMDLHRWDLQQPHPVPPSHPSCRCVLLPVTEMTDMGDDVPRSRANADFDAEAKRAYEAKYPNKKWEDLAASTRLKYYYKAIHDWEKRTGKPAFSPAPGRMKFKDYFLQMSEQQKRDYLGPAKYKLWKTGKYSVDDFIPPYPNKAMTVKELKAKDLASFKK